MHDKYKNIDLDKYKKDLQEIGNVCREKNNPEGFRIITAEWNAVMAYESSMTAPWD